MDEFDVEVAGGALRVCRWPGTGPVVLAAHGITANALAFEGLARALGGRVQLVAPDLRGRARSNALPGPYGMASHATDLIAIADHLGVGRVPLVGHSMGGFVVGSTAAAYPDRISGILLVDGGLPLPVPSGVGIDQVLEAVIGPAMQRLSMTFPSAEAYVSFFRRHPALADGWEPDIEAYVLRDFAGDRSSCSLEAVRADATDTLMTESVIPKIDCPVRLLYAERGMLNEAQGLYDAGRLADVRFPVELVPDVNHYSILFDATAVGRVADRIVELAA
ncbi:alpha/beta hydrolase [Actinoplanes sp. LDG1-06]|uniref:Alpha/beta hydrolase n=1 Tax=Paractinoplanes ovalisporus TaxID=2810368 RepID=A0ABS2AFT3_9ACTN|nr:alpha/beta hydrolase [Actinoplanes ovalisporus]MBM2618676.1 alpha/beta hydrolase [Actinoplanes ovalisporus]